MRKIGKIALLSVCLSAAVHAASVNDLPKHAEKIIGKELASAEPDHSENLVKISKPAIAKLKPDNKHNLTGEFCAVKFSGSPANGAFKITIGIALFDDKKHFVAIVSDSDVEWPSGEPDLKI